MSAPRTTPWPEPDRPARTWSGRVTRCSIRTAPKGEKLDAYFDKARFVNPAPNTYGTLGRNVLRGPGFANVDVSLAKGWRLPFIGEGGRIEYRFEAFNVLNATHLANPVTGLTNPNFGKITGTDGDPRILQMALKVAW